MLEISMVSSATIKKIRVKLRRSSSKTIMPLKALRCAGHAAQQFIKTCANICFVVLRLRLHAEGCGAGHPSVLVQHDNHRQAHLLSELQKDHLTGVAQHREPELSLARITLQLAITDLL